MGDEPTIDLANLARQEQQILTEFGSMRDDAAVLSAIFMRMDGTLTGLVREIHATQPARQPGS